MLVYLSTSVYLSKYFLKDALRVGNIVLHSHHEPGRSYAHGQMLCQVLEQNYIYLHPRSNEHVFEVLNLVNEFAGLEQYSAIAVKVHKRRIILPDLRVIKLNITEPELSSTWESQTFLFTYTHDIGESLHRGRVTHMILFSGLIVCVLLESKTKASLYKTEITRPGRTIGRNRRPRSRRTTRDEIVRLTVTKDTQNVWNQGKTWMTKERKRKMNTKSRNSKGRPTYSQISQLSKYTFTMVSHPRV